MLSFKISVLTHRREKQGTHHVPRQSITVHPRAAGRKAYSSGQELVQLNSAPLNSNQAMPMVLKDEKYKHEGLG